MDSTKLQKPYSRDIFSEMLNEMFPSIYKEDVHNVILLEDTNVVESAQLLGECEFDDEPLAVFELVHSGSENARINISNDAFRIMKDHDCVRALIAFKSIKSEQWRLSLMTIDYRLDEKGKVTSDISNPRRYSFLLGPGAKVHTPIKQLSKSVKDFNDLLSRFSLEVVNKEFYESIAVLFTELVGGTRTVSKKKQEFPGLLELPRTLSESAYQEFAVRLIGRIVFCWFLKEKKSEDGISLMPKELLSLDASKSNENYYETILEKLFFETLNVEIESRDKRYLEDSYKLVPYLNGGLFEPHDGDFYKDAKTIPDSWITRLLEIFETYNFTIDENTISDVDLSIDPEMLGRIFENLLAEINPETGESARKSTGSFYTPREIVNYMVDESLVEILVEKTGIDREKINALVTYDKLDDQVFPLSQEQKEQVVNAVAELKILDPACGSGAFPIGILQKISMILQRADPDASMWFDKQTKSIPDPLLRAAVKEKFKNENLDWVRKLGIIKDVIYGVDIQPIAVEIAKLRCFLTLVVEEKIDDSQPNRGIQPLPNLDFKFVAANSLIQLEAGELNLLQDNELQAKLAEIRSKYFNARKLTSKTKLKEEYRVLNSVSSLNDDDRTMQLRSFDPFVNNKSAEFFDPEYMFGIKMGFDIVIGNPPYGVSIAKAIRSRFDKNLGKAPDYEIFYYFINLAWKILADDGVLTYVIPNTLLFNVYAEKYRRQLLSNWNIKEIIDCTEFPLFKSATVRNCIVNFMNNSEGTRELGYKNTSEVGSLSKLIEKPRLSMSLEEIENCSANWALAFRLSPEALRCVSAIRQGKTPLKAYFHSVSQGLIAYDKYQGQDDDVIKTRAFHFEAGHNRTDLKKWIEGRDVKRYNVEWNGQKFIDYCDGLANPRDPKFFVGERVLVREITNPRIFASYTSEEMYSDPAVITILGNPTFDLWLLLAILNSKVATFYHFNSSPKATKGDFPKILVRDINEFPLPDYSKLDANLIERLSALVQQYSVEESGNRKVEIDLEIDELIYKIYDLAEEEIILVESTFQ